MEQIPRSKYDLRVDGSIGPGERSKSFTSGPARSLLDPQYFDIILPIKSPNKKIKAEDVAKRLESLCGAGAHQQVPLFGHACCVPSANHCTKRALIYLDKGAPTTGPNTLGRICCGIIAVSESGVVGSVGAETQAIGSHVQESQTKPLPLNHTRAAMRPGQDPPIRL